MPRQSIFDMPYAKVFPMLLQKAVKKNRTEDEVYAAASWLTGYTPEQLRDMLASDLTYGEFFEHAPQIHPHASRIHGTVCGVRVETIDDPRMQQVRWLDKLVDDLARGKPLEKILPG